MHNGDAVWRTSDGALANILPVRQVRILLHVTVIGFVPTCGRSNHYFSLYDAPKAAVRSALVWASPAPVSSGIDIVVATFTAAGPDQPDDLSGRVYLGQFWDKMPYQVIENRLA